jgi:hypothetical protein
MINLMDLSEAKKLFDEICAANMDKDKSIMHGIKGEKNHGLDVLTWIEKLNPQASLSLKMAGLFHDVERIAIADAGGGKFSGTQEEYKQYKKAHAKASADYIYPILVVKGLSVDDAKRVSFLITHHDDSREEVEGFEDEDLETLMAADSLSFFDSFGMKMYEEKGRFVLEQKVKFMILKMSPKHQKVLADLDLNNDLFNEIKNKVIKEVES